MTTTPTQPAPVHPGHVAAFEAIIEEYIPPYPGCDVYGLATVLAQRERHMQQEAGKRLTGKVRELKGKVRAHKRLAGTSLPEADERRVKALITGGLSMAINDHGPVTHEWKESAAKRIYANLVSRRMLVGLGREEGL